MSSIETTLDVPGPQDENGLPTTISRSLFSLGFAPTFYQFTEATLDFKIEMKMSIEESTNVHADGKIEASKGPVAIGGTDSTAL